MKPAFANRGFSFHLNSPRPQLHNLATLILVSLTVVLFIDSKNNGRCSETRSAPNIVLILADDLGYAELGCYGQEKIKTPNLDRMAAEGMRFTQHYCGNAVCALRVCADDRQTSRPGLHPQQLRRSLAGRTASEIRHGVRGQEPIPDAEVTIGEMLQARGYATAAIGKWGLGHFGTSGDPNRQGFDLFFGYNCQAHAHSYYPGYLWRNGQKVMLSNHPPLPGHSKLPPTADPNDPRSYEPFKGKDYAADHMIDAALQFLRDNQARPFFLYFPFTIPHLALHIPDEELKPYLGKWEETPYVGGGYTPHRTPRAAYAAMISRLDKDAGRILTVLQELGLDDNTLVLFSSDNGTTHLGKEVDFTFFHSVGPLRGLKGSLYEGGIRVPMIARWPGKIRPSTTTDHLSAFWDVMPTIAEVAGAQAPAGITGISFAPTLLGHPERQQQHEYLYWEFPGYGGQQAVRMGHWKAVRQDMLRRNNPDPLKMELYNLQEDIGESRDLSGEHPDIVARMRKVMATVPRPAASSPWRRLTSDREDHGRDSGALNTPRSYSVRALCKATAPLRRLEGQAARVVQLPEAVELGLLQGQHRAAFHDELRAVHFLVLPDTLSRRSRHRCEPRSRKRPCANVHAPVHHLLPPTHLHGWRRPWTRSTVYLMVTQPSRHIGSRT